MMAMAAMGVMMLAFPRLHGSLFLDPNLVPSTNAVVSLAVVLIRSHPLDR
jgi:hypothetical protein